MLLFLPSTLEYVLSLCLCFRERVNGERVGLCLVVWQITSWSWASNPEVRDYIFVFSFVYDSFIPFVNPSVYMYTSSCSIFLWTKTIWTFVSSTQLLIHMSWKLLGFRDNFTPIWGFLETGLRTISRQPVLKPGQLSRHMSWEIPCLET